MTTVTNSLTIVMFIVKEMYLSQTSFDDLTLTFFIEFEAAILYNYGFH